MCPTAIGRTSSSFGEKTASACRSSSLGTRGRSPAAAISSSSVSKSKNGPTVLPGGAITTTASRAARRRRSRSPAPTPGCFLCRTILHTPRNRGRSSSRRGSASTWQSGVSRSPPPVSPRRGNRSGTSGPIMMRGAVMFGLHRGDLLDHRLEGADRRVLLGREGAFGPKMGEQHGEGILDPAKLLAVAGHIGEDLLLDSGVRGLPELDVDQPDLAADRVEEPGPGIDRLGDVAGQRQSKSGHDPSYPRAMNADGRPGGGRIPGRPERRAGATPQPTLAACAPAVSARTPPVRSSRAGSACALGVSPPQLPPTPAGSVRLGVAGGRGPAALPRRSEAPNSLGP